MPAANAKRNQTAMDETFYLTNIAPQVGEGFNRSCQSLQTELALKTRAHMKLLCFCAAQTGRGSRISGVA